MTSKQPETAQELRQRAEEKFSADETDNPHTLTPDETKNLLHDLRVHQIELEMQNEELRKKQDELDSARSRYFELYDLAPVGYLTFNKQGMIQEANLTAATMLGVTRKALLNNVLSTFIFSEDQDSYFLHHKQAVDNGDLQTWEMRMVRADGEPFWAQFQVTPAQNGECWITFSDITGRKQAADVLIFLAQTSISSVTHEPFFNELARYLAQSLGMDFVCIDRLEGDGLSARTVAVWCDGHFEDNVTYALRDTPCSDVVGKEVCCFPASVCQFFPRDQVLLDLRAESYVGVTLWSHTGQPIGLIAVIGRKPLANRPLTEATLKTVAVRAAAELERLDAEAELREVDRYKLSILNSISDAFFSLDENMVVTYFNTMAEKVLGRRWEEVIGNKLFDVFPEARGSVFEENYTRALKEKIELSFETHFTVPPYENWYIVRVYPYESGISVYFQTITELKLAEEEKAVLQQQLQQAQKLESLGVLAGGIAHDFNNILAIIMGYCGLTKMDYETAENNIPQIEKAVERAAALCRQMLAYAGKATLEKTMVVMWVLVDDVVTMLKATIRQNVVIKTCYSSVIPSFMGDASQLRQIAMNLIINASESIGDMQGEVCVSLSEAVIKTEQPEKDYNGKAIPPGRYVRLEVTDNGCGMDDETKRRIFEPFYTTKFTGRGLGMSAVLGIITSHSGALQLESRSGQGSTFKVYLPVQIGEQPGDSSLQQASSAPWQGSGTILLVEDEEEIRLLAKTILTKLGFTIVEASNGKEALELYQQNAADISLVLLDIGMPGMDGYELFRELKKLNPALPIIISSGFGDTVVTARIPRDEIAGLVGKPYSFDQLREVLKMVVDMRLE